jgi:hypothetical protein
LISAFVIFHLAAVTLWIMPTCVIKARFLAIAAYYVLPLAQWQYWGMFAPDPVHNTVTLEAVVLDANSIFHSFAFPCEASRSRLNATLHYRHSKYAANFSNKVEFLAHREFAARHVIRQLRLPADAFPVQVQLMFRVWPTPPPGTLPDPMLQPTLQVIDTFRFPTLQEALP